MAWSYVFIQLCDAHHLAAGRMELVAREIIFKHSVISANYGIVTPRAAIMLAMTPI